MRLPRAPDLNELGLDLVDLLLVVLVQDLDGALQQRLCRDEVGDVLLVLLVLLLPRLRLLNLALVVGLQRLLVRLDHGLETCRGVVDRGVELLDRTLEGCDLLGPLGDALVGHLALLDAMLLLLEIRLALGGQQLDHLIDLGEDHREGVVPLQQGENSAEERGALRARDPLQELLGPLRARRAHRGPGRGARGPVPPHAGLQECRASGLRRGDGAEGVEGLVGVEDGDGLRERRLLVHAKLHPVLVLFLLRAAHLGQLFQELLRGLDLSDEGLELQLFLAQDAVVVTEHTLLLLVLALHQLISLLHLLHQLLMGRGLLLLCGDGFLQVSLERVPHVLEDPDDLTALCGVRARERSLQEGVDLAELGLRDKSCRRQQGLLHSRPQLQQAAALEIGHVLLVVRSGPQGLVGADIRQHLNRILHLHDGALEVSFQGHEGLVLFVADLLSGLPRCFVLLHVLVQLCNILAELPVARLQFLDLADERLGADDLRLLLLLRGIAVALVLCIQLSIALSVSLGLVQQTLKQLHHLGDRPVLRRHRGGHDARTGLGGKGKQQGHDHLGEHGRHLQ
mmetsp:Transcript_22968/g.52991  ORF Transcript_22968/g.52991 Transcript_22968/m.52991 type:complete len:567 (+) Transcript_22968:701-2401(+)